ncbi:MAG: hypothetical protein ABUL67_01155, partial [Haliangium ochraceum]
GYDRLWAAVTAGAHIDHVTLQGQPTVSSTGFGFGVEGGVDLLRLHEHRVGAYLRLDGTVGTSSGYGGVSFGVAYRL